MRRTWTNSQQRVDAVERGFARAVRAGAIREFHRLPDSTDQRPFWAAEPRSLIVRMPHTFDLAQAELFLAGVAAGLTVTTDAP